MFEYSYAEFSQQSAAQPLLLTVWLSWLFFINLIPALIFIRRIPARWVLAAYVVMLSINFPLGLMFGFSKVLAIPHLLIWIPLIFYLAQEWRSGKLDPQPIYKMWIAIVMATNLTSLVFDARDAVQFIMGDRAPIKADMNNIPYFTFAAVVIALVALFLYLRARPSNTDVLN